MWESFGRTKLGAQGHFPRLFLAQNDDHAGEYARKCQICQRFAHQNHVPPEDLNYVISAWPFMHWGIDIVWILPNTPNKNRYTLVATRLFHQMGRSRGLHDCDSDRCNIKFIWRVIWKNIICPFGVLYKITVDNGTQFIEGKMTKFCQSHGIKMSSSSRSYPQGNGQPESSNKTLFEVIKKKLEDKKVFGPKS